MAGVLKTQKDIERARQQADELKQKVKKLKREIRESSGRLASSAERLCGRTVLRLLQQGTPLSPEAIITQARAIAGKSDQDAFVLLAERLGEMPAQGEGARNITLDPTVRFVLGETLRTTPIAEPVAYAEVALTPVGERDFTKASTEAHRSQLISLIDAEGPIGRELIYARIRQIWGLSQAYPAIKKRIDAHIDALRSDDRILEDGESFWTVGCQMKPRRRSKRFREIYSSDLVPAIELRAAIVQRLLVDAGSIDEITAAVCEMIGYEATILALKMRVQRCMEALYINGDVIVSR